MGVWKFNSFKSLYGFKSKIWITPVEYLELSDHYLEDQLLSCYHQPELNIIFCARHVFSDIIPSDTDLTVLVHFLRI